MPSHTALLDALGQLEQTLQQEGLWQQQAPAADALLSQVPFCADTLTIESWLQFVLLPRLHELAANGLPLPRIQAGQGIGVMLDLQWSQRGIQAPASRRVMATIDQILEAS